MDEAGRGGNEAGVARAGPSDHPCQILYFVLVLLSIAREEGIVSDVLYSWS